MRNRRALNLDLPRQCPGRSSTRRRPRAARDEKSLNSSEPEPDALSTVPWGADAVERSWSSPSTLANLALSAIASPVAAEHATTGEAQSTPPAALDLGLGLTESYALLRVVHDEGLEGVVVEAPGALGEAIAAVGRVTTLPAGTVWFRARVPDPIPNFTTAAQLGTAPAPAAGLNRMRPEGVPMLYGAEDEETAVLEVSASGATGM